MKNDIIIQNALGELIRQTGINAFWKIGTKGEPDGRLEFRYNNEKHPAFIEVKREVRAHQLPALEEMNKQRHPLMVIAEYIFPEIKKELRNRGIAYLETNGNIFFNDGNLFLWVDGLKTKRLQKIKAGRAFTKTGLKLIFDFLLQPELVNLTYREITEKTTIGFGNINFIITDLKEQGFMVPLDKNNYTLHNKKELLDKWMTAFQEKLKPHLFIGAYRFLRQEDQLNWQALPLNLDKTCWGGEPAGEILTRYLKPQEFTLYTQEKIKDLITHYRLIPDPGGDIKVYQQFWTDNNPTAHTKTAPPLLVYADLMNTGDRRCTETAQKIYDAYLQDKF